MASSLLAVKYVFLPKIDDWRHYIASQISQTIGADVQIGHLQAKWHGLHPSAIVDQLQISLPGQSEIIIPQISAVLSWQSLLRLEPVFVNLNVEGLTLTLRKATDGSISVDGFDLHQKNAVDATAKADVKPNHAPATAAIKSDGTTQTDVVKSDDAQNFDLNQALASPALQWLIRQGQINISNVTVVWQDQSRQAPDLLLKNLSLSLRNTLFSHQLSLKATPPVSLSNPIEMGLKIDRLFGQIGAALPGGSDGEIYISANQVNLQAWQPWLNIPDITGTYATRIWFDLQDKKIKHVTLDFAGLNAASIGQVDSASSKAMWSIGRFTSRIEGNVHAILGGIPMPELVSKTVDSGEIIFKLQSQDLHLALPEKHQPVTAIQTADLDLSITRRSIDNISVDINQARIQTQDGQASLLGNWRTSDTSPEGIADLTGQINNLSLPALYRYLPSSTDADAYAWLSHAFQSGTIEQATFVLKGPLADYPFTRDQTQGIFKLSGRYSGLDLNYVPDEPPQSSWPLLKGARGSLNIDQDHVTVSADWGQLMALNDPSKSEVSVQRLRVDVDSITTKPTVSVVSQTVGAAANYLNLIKHSALAEFTPVALANLTAYGNLELPFTANLTLEKPEDVKFDANLLFKQNIINYDDLPLATQLTGQVKISDHGVQFDNLNGVILGGAVKAQGALNSLQSNLLVVGKMSADGIKEFTKSPLMALFKGQFDYQIKVEQSEKKDIKATFESNLKGLSINLPAPLGKTVTSHLPITVELVQNPKSKNSLGTVDLNIGTALKAYALLNVQQASNSDPLFSQVSVGIGREPDKTAKGLSVAAQISQIDIQRWQNAQKLLLQEMDRPTSGRPLLPSLNTFRLSTPLAQISDKEYKDVSLALTQHTFNNWTVDIGSTDISGSIRWSTPGGRLQGPVLAHFPKLEISLAEVNEENTVPKNKGEIKPKPVSTNAAASAKQASVSSDELWDNDFWRKISEVEVRVDDLILYNNHAGSLNLKVTPQLDQSRWKIDAINLVTPHGELYSTGYLRIYGNRGVELDIKADVTDLGKLLIFIGYPDRILNGSGNMSGKIDWADFPWSSEPAGLSGSAKVDLQNGIFEHVNSRSAKMLEILSLQSLRRFFSLDINPDNTFQSGFPWRNITGEFLINAGNVNTQNLVIDSPIAQIALSGDTNMVRQDWNIQAVVKPQLDFSGTALASGFVLNPIVGLTALIGQYILKTPIEKALAAEYSVTGSWDDPKVISGGEVVTVPASQLENTKPEVPAEVQPEINR